MFKLPRFASITPFIRSLHTSCYSLNPIQTSGATVAYWAETGQTLRGPSVVPPSVWPITTELLDGRCGEIIVQPVTLEFYSTKESCTWRLFVPSVFWPCCHCAVEEEVVQGSPQTNKPIYQELHSVDCDVSDFQMLGICQLPLLQVIAEVREPHVYVRHIHIGGISATSSSRLSRACQMEIKTSI